MLVCVFGSFGAVPIFLHMMFFLPLFLSCMSGRNIVQHFYNRYK